MRVVLVSDKLLYGSCRVVSVADAALLERRGYEAVSDDESGTVGGSGRRIASWRLRVFQRGNVVHQLVPSGQRPRRRDKHQALLGRQIFDAYWQSAVETGRPTIQTAMIGPEAFIAWTPVRSTTQLTKWHGSHRLIMATYGHES